MRKFKISHPLPNARQSISTVKLNPSPSVLTATNGNLLKWDNRNPRSTTLKSSLQSSLPEDQFARYERAEAASANAMENVPLFASAVIVGNLAGLKKDGFDGLNAFVATWFGLRIAHTASYIWLADRKELSLVRSGLWISTLVVSFRVFWKAAKALGTAGI
jgi:uncharacterized MAPEG superfamily protein